MLRRHAFRRATYHTRARAQIIFHCTVMRQMPCFLGFGAHVARGGELRRAQHTGSLCTNLRHSDVQHRFDSTWQQSLK